jgi:hypothetical protein
LGGGPGLRRCFRALALLAFCCAPLVLLGVAEASATAAAATTFKGNPAGGRRIRAPLPRRVKLHGTGLVGSSYNWSGYAQSAPNGTYTAVSGTFSVPTVSAGVDSGAEYSSDWVGIGGYADSTLIQAGVEADDLGGSPVYDAWTEVLPAGEDVLGGLRVNPGDQITVKIVEIARNKWKITVADDSTGIQAVRKVRYRSSGASAEAIMERPCIERPCNLVTDLANLAQTTPETFDPVLTATSVPSNSPDFQPMLLSPPGATLEDIVMVDDSGDAIAYPSDANAAGNGFSVADGSTAPSPPG